MASQLVDIHPHIISDDEGRYPPAPLFGKRSDWSQERPSTVENLIAAMDQAGVAKAAVVHSSTTYGFDNRYVVEGCGKYPGRLVAVGSVDVVQPDAPQRIREWTALGLAGLRLFTGGSTKEFDPTELEDPRAYPAWELCAELNLPMCIQTGPIGLPQVTALAAYENIYMKLTPRIFGDVKKEKASAETFFPRVVEAFGAQRLAWGSNYPTSPGALSEILATAQASLACLNEEQREWIFGKTAQQLYPALA